MTEAEQNRLITDHMHLVGPVASEYRGTIDFDDLMGIGREGLVKAARSFNGTLSQFPTWAITKIKGEIDDAIKLGKYDDSADVGVLHDADSIEKIFDWDSWGNRGNAEAICERWSSLEASPEDLSILYDDIKDKRAKFQAAFISLSGNQRKLVTWVFLDSMPITQAASELGVSYFKTIRMLKKALKTMREVITRMESKTNSGGTTANGRPKYSLNGLHGYAPGTNVA